MKVRVRVSLLDDDGGPFMGVGLVWLLTRIRKLHSIRRAAQDMDMSYMKAHAILKRLERSLGRPVLSRYRGGAKKGGAELTLFARQFVASYARHNERVERYARKEFDPLVKGLSRRP